MIDEKDVPRLATVPSLGKLALATFLAAIVAAIVLVVAVLPAEYGIDPLGTGKALGLTELSQATAKPAAAADSTTPKTDAPAVIVPVLEPAADGGAPKMKGTFIAQPSRYKIDSREMTLKPGEGMEIKYNMRKGGGLIYSWIATEPLQFEFHGEPNVKPAGKAGTDYYETYELDDKVGKTESHGTFVAPSTGIHGWFWENKSGKEVTLKLATAGYYDWIFENRNDKETALKTMDVDVIPSHPKVPDQPLR